LDPLEAGDIWKAECDTTERHLYQFTNDEGPRGNHFAFCPYCGKRLKEGKR
jgi:hypothetical protein